MPKTPTHDVYFVVKKPGVKDGKKKRDVWTRMEGCTKIPAKAVIGLGWKFSRLLYAPFFGDNPPYGTSYARSWR